MSVEQAALLGMEQVINQVLDLDPRSKQRLLKFHGSVIGFEIMGLGFKFCFVPDHRGRVQVLSGSELSPDCLMRGTPLDLANTLLQERKEDALFSGRIEVRGDTDLAHRFSDIMNTLNIDWEEQLAKLVGDVAAHETGKAVRSAERWAGRTAQISEQNLQEYLQEEARVVPTRYEVNEWQDEVDRLRDDVERMEARVARLEKRSEGSGEKQ